MDLLFILSLLLLFFQQFIGTHGEGYCRFPEFMWTPSGDGTRRRWLTETLFMKDSEQWERQKEVVAKETELVLRDKVQIPCRGKRHRNGEPCIQKDILYRILCLAEEAGHKYRVHLKGEKMSIFSCMVFTQKNKNVVQIFAADPSSLNEDRLCHDDALKRQEWPWIAPEQQDWSRCPIVGGFDFRVQLNKQKQMCQKIWRPSRFESECIHGEGVDFIFPTEECSPFPKQPLDKHLECWASWTDDNDTFIVLADSGQHPSFVLRLPSDIQTPRAFKAHLFFSPVTPLTTEDSSAKKVVKHLELNMHRSEPGVCYDESEKCQEFSREGKCTNTALHKYANFCKKSCGLCDFVPSTRSECIFPIGYQGRWTLIDSHRKETISVSTGEMFISHLGKFICKSKHWDRDHYKLLSVYDNGCRPRYTCVHFQQDEADMLRFRISRSRSSDESFEMCSFKDDPEPLHGAIRSSAMKILLNDNKIRWGSCGLSGEVRVNVTFPNGKPCDATLTDWNPRMCTTRSKLILATDVSCWQKQRYDFICSGHMDLGNGHELLVTEQHHPRKYTCWVIHSKRDNSPYSPWYEGYQLTKGECGQPEDFQYSTAGPKRLYFHTYSDKLEQPCKKSKDEKDRYWERTTAAPPVHEKGGSSTQDKYDNSGGGGHQVITYRPPYVIYTTHQSTEDHVSGSNSKQKITPKERTSSSTSLHNHPNGLFFLISITFTILAIVSSNES